MQIDSVSSPFAASAANALTDKPTSGVSGGKSFGAMLSDAISEVNTAQVKAGEMTTKLAAGEKVDVHQVMIASQEAGVALNLALQVRNKLVDAYQEVMRVNM